MRILVVDDDPGIREMLTEVLQAPETVVETAGSLREARACLAATRYDWATLDVQLPDGSGLALLPALRGMKERVRAVVISSLGDDPVLRAHALADGAEKVFCKPISLLELHRYIHGGKRPAWAGPERRVHHPSSSQVASPR